MTMMTMMTMHCLFITKFQVNKRDKNAKRNKHKHKHKHTCARAQAICSKILNIRVKTRQDRVTRVLAFTKSEIMNANVKFNSKTPASERNTKHKQLKF